MYQEASKNGRNSSYAVVVEEKILLIAEFSVQQSTVSA